MKRVLVLGAALLAVYCRAENMNPVDNLKTASDERDLQMKNFTSGCSLKPLDTIMTAILTNFAATIKGSETVYKFDGANVTRTTNLFTSSNCDGQPAIRFQERGSFNLHKDQKTTDGAKAIDMDFKTLHVTPLTAEGVVAANAVQLCDSKDWAPGIEREVTMHARDARCLGVQLPRHDSNVYRIDANVLHFGSSPSENTNPSQRPASLNMKVPYSAR